MGHFFVSASESPFRDSCYICVIFHHKSSRNPSKSHNKYVSSLCFQPRALKAAHGFVPDSPIPVTSRTSSSLGANSRTELTVALCTEHLHPNSWTTNSCYALTMLAGSAIFHLNSVPCPFFADKRWRLVFTQKCKCPCWASVAPNTCLDSPSCQTRSGPSPRGVKALSFSKLVRRPVQWTKHRMEAPCPPDPDRRPGDSEIRGKGDSIATPR
jgi:hypothetical protein